MGYRLSNRLFGPPEYKNEKLDYSNIPSVVFSYVELNIHVRRVEDIFSHPPIGTVGLSEPEAREKYGDSVKICT